MFIYYFTYFIDILLIVYIGTFFIVYFIMLIFSIKELFDNILKNRYFDYNRILSFSKIPSVSVIAPAYNEEVTIVENIKCLLNLQYPDFEIIIVNDGSKDNSLEKIIKYFDLIKIDRAYELEVPCAPIRGIYKSFNPAYNRLLVIDKENGGKADALNAGINVSRKDLFLALDVDCIIEHDAITKMVKPFIDETDSIVVACGGVIRVANSCEIEDGRIVKINFPKQFWAKFQVIEYLRAFTLGRMAWSNINGLLIISGAFGLFDRQRVVKVGGYDKSTVGEDLELVVRLRKYMYEVEKIKHKIAFIPDPLCWTEVPSSFNILSRQRNRWTRGAIDTIIKHKKMFFNPRYGVIGMLSFPYWVMYEWLAPFVQSLGLIYLAILVYLGRINIEICVMILIFSIIFSVLYTSIAVFFEAFTYNKYKGIKYFFQINLLIILELIIYQPLGVIFALAGNYNFFFRKKKSGWGNMTRTGFSNQGKQ
ncbi:MAG: glycosyltransferase [Bacteroidetes bacterium]|nr:glycosyltransferase [Bacteroidota bacterium]